MPTPQSLPWTEPLELAATISEPAWVLLYSGVRTDYSGRYSYLACDLAERVEGSDFTPLEKRLGEGGDAMENAWFGYLGYGLKDCLESLPADQPGWLKLPHLTFMRFHSIYRFDHEAKTLTLWQDRPRANIPQTKNGIYPIQVSSLRAQMPQKSYMEKASRIIERIHAGDLYQANLTRKITGEFAQKPDTFALFKRLCEVSPAPYSAYIKLDDTAILSSSPEMFLKTDAKGLVRTRPIKGTAPRYADTVKDKKSREMLAQSPKDKAENLMIVDLMRNDLSRGCIPGSVQAESLFDVTSHATIHHMSSTVVGRKQPDCSTIDVVKHCFPPGSMTGAPKLAAMHMCSALEQLERGVYSGAIGWFGGDGSCELSVVIRTLIVQGTQFEFQVGGGIVADSTPEREFLEIIDKSKGILSALGLTTADFPL